MTALGRAHSVGTAESGCRRRPHIGTCDRYMICSHAGRPRQARAFRRPSRASSRPSRRAPTPARRRTAARGGPRAHRKTGSTFGDPVLLSPEWRTGAGPTEMTLGNRSTALSVPHRSARPPPAAPGLPLGLLFSASGRCAPLALGHVGSQPALPPDGASCSRNAPRFVPRRERLLAFGAGRTSQWAERSARQRLSRV
jgi:hypothetical protein